MAVTALLRPNDLFLCSVCLDVFTDPVTAPCGHNFCRQCIDQHWDMELDCPVCKECFSSKPELKVNSCLSLMVHQFRGHGQANEPQDALCDVCPRSKEKAVKSCLECLTSYCQTHLEPHQQVPDLREHSLIQPVQKMVQLFAVDLTLDPDTAHPELVVSKDGKRVHHGRKRKDLSDDAFPYRVSILSKESFSSGRFYFEVWANGKTKWDLGVVRESISKKGELSTSPWNGFWVIWLRKRKFYAAAQPFVSISVASPPKKVGVFVDYDKGLVSFYNVDTAALLYSFTDCYFNGRLRPYFCPWPNDGGTNSAPMIICSVKS